MIRIIYAFSLILLLAPNVMAEENINFSFNCKVLDQQLLGVMDGKSSRYSGYTGGSNVGGTFKLNFSYVEPLEGRYTLMITSDHKEVGIYSRVSNDLLKSVSTTGVFLWKDELNSMQRVNENIINIEGVVSSQIRGRRYYKNDWNLMIRAGSSDGMFIQTANCMNVPDKLGIIMEKIRAIHKSHDQVAIVEK